tara:strand:+ start:2226 stop:2498 length:273 start_codon:yes stop_codon:yes gene_type:complete
METTKEKHATFTPRPWVMVQERDYLNIQETETNLIVAQFCSVSEANARLIALAPEMHQLLVRVSKGNGYDSLSLAMDARELLAKVEGGEG